MDSRIIVGVTLHGPCLVDDQPTDEVPSFERFKVRLFSEWLACSCSSEVFGETGHDWVVPSEHKKAQNSADFAGNVAPPQELSNRRWKSTFKAAFEPHLDSTQQLQTLNSSPGIYAVFIHEKSEDKENPDIVKQIPVAFSYIDCSSFVLRGGTLHARNIKVMSYIADLEVKLDSPLLPREELLALEPVLIDINDICSFPLLEGESAADAATSCYCYGELHLGGGLQRSILGFPYVDKQQHQPQQEEDASSNSTFEQQAKFKIDLKICLLPGLINIPQVKDSFKSSTLVLQIHSEDVVKRAFHVRNIEEYASMMQQSENGSSGGGGGGRGGKGAAAGDKGKGGKGAAKKKPAAADKGAKKGAPAAAVAAAEEEGDAAVATLPAAEMSSGDQFLLQAIKRALTTARQIRPHGTIRFRLEQLLSSSSDLLRRFARTRRNNHGSGGNGSNSQQQQQLNDDNDVVVEEDMILEVRLEKPSQPEKWDLPSDISLKSALSRAKEATQSHFDGTLAATATGNSGSGGALGSLLSSTGGKKQSTSVAVSKPPPRHERFFAEGTNVSLQASLHRKLLPYSELVQSVEEGKEDTDDEAAESGEEEGGDDNDINDVNEDVNDNDGNSVMTDSELLRRLQVTPFTRMIVSFNYLDDETLHAINDGVNAINSEALPDIQGTIRSYSFTAEEVTAAKEARLDVVTGLMIIDDDRRLLVLEGKAAPGCAMERMFTEFLPRKKPNDDSLRILCNPEVLFPHRSYPEFGPDLRRIRIRDKLKKLARRPEVYNRKQVEEICFEAIDGLMALRRAVDLDSTKKLDLYPSAASLNKLELLYGEAITRLDMDGTKRIEYKDNYLQSRDGSRRVTPRAGADALLLHSGGGGDTARSRSRAAATSAGDDDSQHSQQRKRGEYQTADCRNPEFEEHLRNRPPPVDYLKQQRTLLRQAWKDALRRREKRNDDFAQTVRTVLGAEHGTSAAVSNTATAVDGGKPPKIYLYSQQTLNFKEKSFDQLRQKVAQDKSATYSFSKDFISQTVCAVDEAEEVRKSKARNKAEWLTPSGFQYPKPKTRRELLQHPQRPSDARIAELQQPFTDTTDVSALADEQAKDPALQQLEHGFTTRFKVQGEFGALKPPDFEREFQLKLVGDRQSLPRGRMKSTAMEPDPNCFRSVHLGGEKQAQIVADAIAQEKQSWQEKVIHEHIDMKVGGYRVRDVAIQSDRNNDILKGEAKREALQHLRNRRSHRDNDWSYTTAPLSLLNAEPYVPNARTNGLVRSTDYSKFITTKLMSEEQYYGMTGTAAAAAAAGDGSPGQQQQREGQSPTRRGQQRSAALDPRPQDFHRYIHKDTFNPKLLAIVSKRKHPPQDPVTHSDERKGPKWETPTAFSSSGSK